jgi:hypothetical protein
MHQSSLRLLRGTLVAVLVECDVGNASSRAQYVGDRGGVGMKTEFVDC